MRPLRKLASCLLAALAVGATGCATTLSSFQTAEPVARGQFQVITGAGFYGPLGASLNAIDKGKDQAEQISEAVVDREDYTLSAREQEALLMAGLALAVLPPSPNYELGIRTGVGETDWDVGFRYSVNALRLDTKYRVLHRETDGGGSLDVAVGLGLSKYLLSNPVVDVLDYVQLGDFSRWDVELPLYLSARPGPYFLLYGGPRWLYSRVTLDSELVKLSAEGAGATGRPLELPSLVHMHFYGATAGVAVGPPTVRVMLELTGGYTRCKPVLLGARRSLGGATVYPAAGLALSF